MLRHLPIQGNCGSPVCATAAAGCACLDGVVVSIPDCQSGDPGSNPGRGVARSRFAPQPDLFSLREKAAKRFLLVVPVGAKKSFSRRRMENGGFDLGMLPASNALFSWFRHLWFHDNLGWNSCGSDLCSPRGGQYTHHVPSLPRILRVQRGIFLCQYVLPC